MKRLGKLLSLMMVLLLALSLGSVAMADAPLLIAQQVALMTTICGIFKINIKKDGLKALATAARCF